MLRLFLVLFRIFLCLLRQLSFLLTGGSDTTALSVERMLRILVRENGHESCLSLAKECPNLFRAFFLLCGELRDLLHLLLLIFWLLFRVADVFNGRGCHSIACAKLTQDVCLRLLRCVHLL